MKRTILVFMMAFALAFSGCSEKKAKELFETAQFEELQKNQVHAKQLYEEIINEYPKTDYAKKAEERLSVLKE
jgi:TolA-binding protein